MSVKRIIIISVLSLFSGVLLLSVGLALLPGFINNHAVQARIQKAISSSLKRRVAWSNLSMTWSDGVSLSGLTLGDGPAPLLKADIDQIAINAGYGRGPDGRLGIDLVVRISNVRAELVPAPPKPPPPATKDPLTQLAEAIQKVQGLDFPLPVDLRVTIDVAPLQLAYRAPSPDRQLQLHDFSLHFAMPSLAVKPVTAALKGRVSLGGCEMGMVSFNAKVSDLVTKERRIHLSTALFDVAASAPGTSISLGGGLSQAEGFTAQWQLDLPAMLAVARPFVPAGVPGLEGRIALQLRAKNDAKNDLHASLALEGEGVAATGGALNTTRIGPLGVRLKQRIATDQTRRRVDFPDGSLAITGLADASWSASVVRPSAADRSLELQFGPMRMNLARAFSLAAPFLPSRAPVRELAGEVSLRSLSLLLNGPGNNGAVTLDGFGITIPRARLTLDTGELTTDDLHLLLDHAESPLSARLPTRLSADLLWRVSRAAFSGDRPLLIQGARGKLGLSVTDLSLKSSSPRKVSGSALLTQSSDFDRVSLGSQITIEKIHEQLRLLAQVAGNGDIDATLPEFAVSAASLQGIQAGRPFGPLPLSASLTASGAHLPADKGGGASLQRAAGVISAGDFLQLALEGALSGSSPGRATSTGTARLDLRRAMPFGALFAPAGAKAEGVVSAYWDLSAPLPGTSSAAEKHPLRKIKSGLSLFDALEFGLKLDSVSATIPAAGGTFTVAGLRTGPDLRLVSTKKGEVVTLEGGVLFSGVSGLPGMAGKLPPQHGSCAFDGALTGWREFRLHEGVRIDPLSISHEAELNVNRIDTLLDEEQPFSPATLVKRLNATLFATVEGAFPRESNQFISGPALAGDIRSGIRIDLSAGHDLALRYSLASRNFDAILANGTSIEGLRSDITINRVYALAAAPDKRWQPLSASLVRPAAVTTVNPGAAEIAGRINDDLRGDVHGSRSFSIRRISTRVSGAPMVITALEGDLLFGREKAGLGFLQADMLGGTILARSVFDLQPEIPVFEAAGSFSNLDSTYLLPKESRKQGGDDAEMTGELRLAVPLTSEQREMLEQLRLAVNVRKIGAHAIERALFSLDPYEHNEQLVAQRKMLRLGTLRGLRANAVDGAFSMEGEARIKGVAVDLPKVERLRISELPLRQELIKNRGAITSLRTVLDLVRADTLVVGPKGELILQRGSYEK